VFSCESALKQPVLYEALYQCDLTALARKALAPPTTACADGSVMCVCYPDAIAVSCRGEAGSSADRYAISWPTGNVDHIHLGLLRLQKHTLT